MQQQFTEVDGTMIAYIEKNPSAPFALVFIHGNSGSVRMWNKQLESPLLNSYHLLAFDLPAHGMSGADVHHRYGVQDIGTLLAKAIKAMVSPEHCILVGISMGANVVAEMLREGIQPAGIVLAGPTIIGDEFHLANIGLPTSDSSVIFTDEAEDSAVSQFYAQALHLQDKNHLEALASDYRKVRAPFRSTLLNKAMNGEISNELALLRELHLPLLVIFGREEKVINPDYLDSADLPKWNNQVYKIPGAGHLVNLDQPQIFNELVAVYAEERFTEVLVSAHSATSQTHS